MRRRALAAAFCLALSPLLAQCAGDDLAKVVPGDRVTTSTRDAGAAARMISEYRVARGLAPVAADSQLNEAAVYQARAVAEAGRLSHGAFASRMDSYSIGGAAAENLTAGSGDVASAIGRWKASPAHNGNLLMKEARRIGLARADSPGHGYKTYWALVLAQ
ncbi:CAP domain-containing protein [uncultured Enterovirga sp.]|uniref:CAP domain-containing protein n=1 Tax=uncultured Enterovirga sp. TaxID=2026352 RepID=UPI0035CB42F0